MPKGFMTPAQRMAAEDRAADARLVERINCAIGALGTNQEAFARMIGVSKTTFLRKMKAPETFYLKEIRNIERLIEKADKLLGGGEKVA